MRWAEGQPITPFLGDNEQEALRLLFLDLTNLIVNNTIQLPCPGRLIDQPKDLFDLLQFIQRALATTGSK